MAKNKIKLNPKKFIHERVVIDASVLMKFFLEEDGSEIVDDLVGQHLEFQMTLMATPLLRYELLNILSNKLKDPKRVQEAFDRVEEIGIAIIEPLEKHIAVAIRVTCDNSQISYYDVSYHMLAKDIDATFLTADKRYYDLMKKEGNVALFA